MSVYIASVMSVFKPLLYLSCKSVDVQGLPVLIDLLKRKQTGVITVANHISVLDDPLVWAAMPFSSYFDSRSVRWTLGAHDILFTNPLFATLFRNGQVIETFRGKGIYQPAVSLALEKLDERRWVHIFPEGKVNQRPIPTTPPSPSVSASSTTSPAAADDDYHDNEVDDDDDDPAHPLLRFRWGVSRLLMESRPLPSILPIHISGFDTLMPEDRSFPRFLPRVFPRKRVSITVGKPLEVDERRLPLLTAYRSTLDRPTLGIPHLPGKTLPAPGEHPTSVEQDTALARKVRVEVAGWLREEVGRLGEEVRERARRRRRPGGG